MPKTMYKEKDFKKLFLKVQRLTMNFSRINTKTLSKNPQFIKVFRILMNKSMPEMGKLLNKSHATIAQYERNAIKKIPTEETGKMKEIILEELPKEIDFKNTIKNFNRFKQLSEGGQLLGFKRAEGAQFTKQEEQIKNILEENMVEYEAHKTLETQIGPLNYDFWLPKDKLVIECTESLSKHKAESLGFRIMKLKQKNKCKSIAIVPDDVSKGVLRRLQDFDRIVFSSDIQKLGTILK